MRQSHRSMRAQHSARESQSSHTHRFVHRKREQPRSMLARICCTRPSSKAPLQHRPPWSHHAAPATLHRPVSSHAAPSRAHTKPPRGSSWRATAPARVRSHLLLFLFGLGLRLSSSGLVLSGEERRRATRATRRARGEQRGWRDYQERWLWREHGSRWPMQSIPWPWSWPWRETWRWSS